VSNELRYFEALKRITQYQSLERMRRHAEKDWGLPFDEVLEMAYDNIQTEARNAIRGKRRPKISPSPSCTPSAPPRSNPDRPS
jgi:hypothetical protein